MRSRLFNFAAAVSLVLCLASVGLWVRSYRGQEKWFGRVCVMSNDGDIGVFRLVPNGVTEFDFHYWQIALPLSAIPLLWLVQWRFRTKRRSHGHCHHCGYNLTGNTSGVCPECGTAIAAKMTTLSGGDSVRAGET